MPKYKTRSFEVTAVQSDGSNIDEFIEAIGPGAKFLDIKYQNVGGPGRGMVEALVIKSVHRTWTVRKGEVLIWLEDESVVWDQNTFETFFEEAEK